MNFLAPGVLIPGMVRKAADGHRRATKGEPIMSIFNKFKTAAQVTVDHVSSKESFKKAAATAKDCHMSGVAGVALGAAATMLVVKAGIGGVALTAGVAGAAYGGKVAYTAAKAAVRNVVKK